MTLFKQCANKLVKKKKCKLAKKFWNTNRQNAKKKQERKGQLKQNGSKNDRGTSGL